MQTRRGWVRQGTRVAVVLGFLLLPLLSQTGLAQGQPRSGVSWSWLYLQSRHRTMAIVRRPLG